jgi:Uncharacterized protein conserved in bacteria containing a pentein-type domain
MKQITNTIFMVRPVRFRLNEQTAVNNYYQDKTADLDDVNHKAQQEFDGFVTALKQKGVRVIVVND